MRWIGTVARTEGWTIAVSIGEPDGRDQLENLGLDGKIILK
jgi:hypothetical protein